MNILDRTIEIRKKFENIALGGKKISDAEYFGDKTRINASSLKVLLKEGWKSFDVYMQKPQKITEAMAVGTLVHTMILEPETFDSKYIVIDEEKIKESVYKKLGKEWLEGKKAPERTNDFKNLKEELTKKALGKTKITKWDDYIGGTEQEYEGLLLVPMDIYENAKAMRYAVEKCDPAMQIINSSTKEVVYHDNILNVPVKVKIDLASQMAISDLKTIDKIPTPKNAIRQVYDYSYHLSMALYCMVTGTDNASFIFVQKKAPYNVAYYEIGEEMLEEGLVMLEKALDQYKLWKEDSKKERPRYFTGIL